MQQEDNLNNLSQVPFESVFDATTEENSESSDSDLEVLAMADGHQKCFTQSLKSIIKRNQRKINDLAAKLLIAENSLASEKEKTKDKEDLIKSLKLLIDALKDNSGQSQKGTECDLHKTIIDELNADIEVLECKLKNRNEKIAELEDKTDIYEINIKEKDEHITNLESQIKLSLDTTQKYESDLMKKDEQITKLESQAKADATKIRKLVDNLSKFTEYVVTSDENTDPLVLLNCTKISPIQFVKLPNFASFAAVFEDLPSAGPGWMLIQRRIDGSVSGQQYSEGFGDLSREFWLGCEKLHILTTNKRHELYIELVDFDNATAYARYDNFVVGSAQGQYALKSVGQYSGNAGNCLQAGLQCQFLTTKVVYSGSSINSRASYEHIGWWQNADCNLNGKYYGYKTVLTSTDGIWWGTWNMGNRHSLKACKMLIRPRP